jgi:hypothetical protein
MRYVETSTKAMTMPKNLAIAAKNADVCRSCIASPTCFCAVASNTFA